jgi:hypothetical protein
LYSLYFRVINETKIHGKLTKNKDIFSFFLPVVLIINGIKIETHIWLYISAWLSLSFFAVEYGTPGIFR